MRRNILFIVTSFWSNGELQIALDFASRLDPDKWCAQFLVGQNQVARVNRMGFSTFTLVPTSGLINKLIMMDIEKRHKPDAVVLSDFVNFEGCDRHFGLTSDDLKLFSGRLGTFDIYQFDDRTKQIDTYGMVGNYMNNLCTQQYDFLLQPVPICSLEAKGKDNRVIQYSLASELSSSARQVNLQWRQKFDLPQDKKVVLVPLSQWQYADLNYERGDKARAIFNVFFSTLVSEISRHHCVVVVGESSLSFEDRGSSIVQFGNLSETEFSELGETVDAVVSTNFISTSVMIKAVAGVPTLLLQSSFSKNKNVTKWVDGKKRKIAPEFDVSDYVFPCRVMPVGWYAFLEHLVTEPSVYGFIEKAELSDIEDALSSLDRLLYDFSELETKRKAYINGLKTLMQPSEIVVL